MSDYKERPDYQVRLTNRHIAKVLTRLKELNLPQIVLDDIKRSFWFLSDDLVTEKTGINRDS